MKSYQMNSRSWNNRGQTAAVISVLSFAFTLLLKPVNKDIQNLKEGQSRIETELENMRKDIYEIKTAFVSSSTTRIIKK